LDLLKSPQFIMLFDVGTLWHNMQDASAPGVFPRVFLIMTQREEVFQLSNNCKMPGKEHLLAAERFDACECESCEYRHECRFVKYIPETKQYGPFNCAGENVSA